jgi:metal-dependent amidase/aminoacylase/carboxypeptidase family protein
VTYGVAAAFGVSARVAISGAIPPTVNHAAEAEMAAASCAESAIPLRRDLAPAMTSEDFGWYLKELPGAFVWIGSGPSGAGRDLHSDGYDFNDAILPVAAAYLAGVANRALRE